MSDATDIDMRNAIPAHRHGKRANGDEWFEWDVGEQTAPLRFDLYAKPRVEIGKTGMTVVIGCITAVEVATDCETSFGVASVRD